MSVIIGKTEAATPEQQAIVTWVKKAVRNYLNKSAATETKDPLAELEIPARYGLITWGKAIRTTTSAFPAWLQTLLSSEDVKTLFQNTPSTEPIYNFSWSTLTPGNRPPSLEQSNSFLPSGLDGSNGFNDFEAAKEALINYLRHVGEYLEANVAPEDLQKYDLVRAVRETNALDAKIKKKALSIWMNPSKFQ